MLQKLDERSDRVPTERTGSLGHIIYDILQFLILRLKELVQVVKLWPDHIPVVVACFGIQQIFVCWYRGEHQHNAFTLFL
jgi:hypothetical protein